MTFYEMVINIITYAKYTGIYNLIVFACKMCYVHLKTVTFNM